MVASLLRSSRTDARAMLAATINTNCFMRWLSFDEIVGTIVHTIWPLQLHSEWCPRHSGFCFTFPCPDRRWWRFTLPGALEQNKIGEAQPLPPLFVFVIVYSALLYISSCAGQAQAQPPSEEPPPRDVRQELLEWENASSLLPAPTEETSSHAYPSASGLHEGAATRNGHGGQPMNEESSPSRFSRAASLENGLAQKLPWESTERYVIGSGELGLLNELQMPRRGSVVSLSPEFLRVPPPPPFLALTTAAAPEAAAADGFEEDNSQEAPPCVEPLIHLGGYKDDDNDSVEPVHLSPIVRPSDDDDDPAGARGGRAGGSEERVGWQHPLATPSSVMSSPVMPSSVKPSAKPSARPSIKPATAVFTPPRALPELSYGGAETKTPKNGRGTAWGAGDNDNDDDDVGGWNKSGGGAQGFSRRRAERARRDLVRDPAAAVVGSADASGPPLLRGGQPRRKGPGAATESARNVETASAADRIAAYRPGTRFHVAVDKGAIGLGITVKDICGRFFVYRLQALADGSPGSAEVSTRLRHGDPAYDVG